MSSEIQAAATLLPREEPPGTHTSWRGPQSQFGGFKGKKNCFSPVVKSHYGGRNCQFNPFQFSFSANRMLPSSYLFWAVKRLVDYL
jgi:hypothetical protein